MIIAVALLVMLIGGGFWMRLRLGSDVPAANAPRVVATGLSVQPGEPDRVWLLRWDRSGGRTGRG